jgi:hemolysin activation/secretion protein
MDFINQDTTYPGGPQALSDDSLRVVWLRTDASATAADRPFRDNLVTTATDVSVQVRKGLDVLGASQAGATNLSRAGGQADGWVVRGESHALLRVVPNDAGFLPVTFSAHFIGQWADRPLLAYEQQPIGNLTIGRGYDPNAASGERVAAGEFKIEIGPKKLLKGITVTPYVFDDIMYVGYLQQGQADVTLRSLGGGFEFRIPYDKRGNAIRIDAGYAKPLDKPIPSAVAKPPAEYLLQVVVAH